MFPSAFVANGERRPLFMRGMSVAHAWTALLSFRSQHLSFIESLALARKERILKYAKTPV